MKTTFRSFHLSAPLMAIVLALVALPFAVLGVTPEAAGYAAVPVLVGALLVKPSESPIMYRLRNQFGKLGEVMDANETAFFTRQLEKIKAKTYDILYPELKATQLLPVDTSAGPGAATIVYYQYDQVGQAKIIASYADDLPRADILGKEFTARVRSVGASYGYNIQEIRSAAMAGQPLQQRKANAARRAIEQKVDSIAWFGDATHNLVGFLNNPNVTRVVLPNDGVDPNGDPSTKLIYKTPDQVLRDLNTIANTSFLTTKGIEIADSMLLPLEIWTFLTNTPRTSGTDTSIMKWFRDNNPFIKNFTWLNELEGAGVLDPGSNVIVAYRKDPDKLTLEIPQPFEQFPEQEHNLEFVVPCHERTAGVIVYYPLSVVIGEGV